MKNAVEMNKREQLKKFIGDELEYLRKKSATSKGMVKSLILAKVEAYAKVAGYIQGLDKQEDSE